MLHGVSRRSIAAAVVVVVPLLTTSSPLISYFKSVFFIAGFCSVDRGSIIGAWPAGVVD
ncbi:unnamed protein product [Rhodiola kirilowii]